jgi:hypothetical protein
MFLARRLAMVRWWLVAGVVLGVLVAGLQVGVWSLLGSLAAGGCGVGLLLVQWRLADEEERR